MTGWRTALLKERPAGWCYSIYANTDANRPSGHVFTNAEVDTRGTAQLAANTWSHLAATYDGATLKLYVNGTLASSKAVTGSLFNSTERCGSAATTSGPSGSPARSTRFASTSGP